MVFVCLFGGFNSKIHEIFEIKLNWNICFVRFITNAKNSRNLLWYWNYYYIAVHSWHALYWFLFFFIIIASWSHKMGNEQVFSHKILFWWVLTICFNQKKRKKEVRSVQALVKYIVYNVIFLIRCLSLILIIMITQFFF